MTATSDLLDNMYPVSAFSRGQAARVLSSATDTTPVIVLKNNTPYRVITTTDEYTYLTELEEDMALLAEAYARLTTNEGKEAIPAAQVYKELDVAADELDSMDDVELA